MIEINKKVLAGVVGGKSIGYKDKGNVMEEVNQPNVKKIRHEDENR